MMERLPDEEEGKNYERCGREIGLLGRGCF
jgi:hypothetical protein